MLPGLWLAGHYGIAQVTRGVSGGNERRKCEARITKDGLPLDQSDKIYRIFSEA